MRRGRTCKGQLGQGQEVEAEEVVRRGEHGVGPRHVAAHGAELGRELKTGYAHLERRDWTVRCKAEEADVAFRYQQGNGSVRLGLSHRDVAVAPSRGPAVRPRC